MSKSTYIKPEIKFLPQEEAASKWLGLAVEHGGKGVNIEDKATDQKRFWSTDVFVYVTSYENHIAYGKVEFPYLAQIADFQGLDNLLLMIEDAMDFANAENKGAHYPQSTFEKRTIALKKQPANSSIYDFKGSTPVSQITPPMPHFTGKKIAFAAISVRYRQHASMQGILKTAVGNTPFRSGMELLRLLNQLLSATQDS